MSAIGNIQDNSNFNPKNPGFPSHNKPMEEKMGYDWCFQYVKAFHSENERGIGSNLFRNKSSLYKEWRDLAKGRQDADQYKPQLGVKKGDGRNRSWRALDWSILPIAPKFVNILTGKLLNSVFGIKVNPIDPQSEEEKNQFKNKLKETVINGELIDQVQQMTGVPFEDTQTTGIPRPENLEEVETIADMFFKNEYAMEGEDAIALWNQISDWRNVYKEVAVDLIEVGVGATRPWIDKNGSVKYRRCVPERMIANACRFNDFRDALRIGEYVDYSLSDLRDEAGDQFSEQDYKDIEEHASVRMTDYPYDVNGIYNDYRLYPWDKEKITVLDAVWFSVDDEVHLLKPNRYGNENLVKQKSNFPYSKKEGRRIKDSEYLKRYPERKIVRKQLKNVYRAKWIVGTKYMFDFGLATNMIREAKDLSDTKLPYNIYTTDFDSLMRMIAPVIHNCQLNWLQYQNHIARSKPSGISIEMSALEGVNIGKGKQHMSPKEVLRMYMDTGVLVWRRKQYNNASNQWKPVDQLQNAIGENAAFHLQAIISNIDLLRNIIGINEVEDASTPNPNILKGVAEIASLGTNNALSYLYHGFKNIIQRTSKDLLVMTPDARKISKHQGFADALGRKSDKFWKEFEFREMGVDVLDQPDAEDKERLSRYIQVSLEQGMITPDEAYAIEKEDNTHRAALMLKSMRKAREAEQQQRQMEAIQAEEQKNINSAQAAAQADQQKVQIELGMKAQADERRIQLEMMRDKEKLSGEILLEKLRQGHDLTEAEYDRVTRMMEIDRQGQWNLAIEASKPDTTQIKSSTKLK